MFQELFYPRQVVLVTASASDKTNVTAVEWIMPVSEKPPMAAFSLHKSSLTLDLICTSMEAVIAIPTEKMKDAVVLCGSTSGKFIDKFQEAGISQGRANAVSAPLVLEAAANLECKVLSYSAAGDHTLILVEIVEAHLPKDNEISDPLVFSRGGKKLFGLKND